MSTLSFTVSIENSGFMVSTPFFSSFLKKNVFLKFKMSTMHADHSRVSVDLEKILQFYVAAPRAKKLFFFYLQKHFSGLVKMESD